MTKCVFYLRLLVTGWAEASVAVVGRLIGQTLHTVVMQTISEHMQYDDSGIIPY